MPVTALARQGLEAKAVGRLSTCAASAAGLRAAREHKESEAGTQQRLPRWLLRHITSHKKAALFYRSAF